jgi:hypothetical protein
MANGFVFQKPMLYDKTTNKVSKQYYKVPYMTIHMGSWKINSSFYLNKKIGVVN